MVGNNVVRLARSDEINGKASIPDSGPPELIRSAKRIAVKRLKAALQAMFDNVDDCLFEYADKSDNNQQQLTYFDAMREIRLKKEAITGTWFREFDRLFTAYLQGDADATGSSVVKTATTVNQPIDFGSLSLVEDDDLEVSLAMTNLEAKINSLYRESLIALAQRLDYVLNEVGLVTESHPLCARVLCESFAPVVEMLSVNVEIKLVVLKLYDKYVVQHLTGLYDEVNSMLVAAGVLPQIRTRAVVKSESRYRSTHLAEQELLSELQSDVMSPAASAGDPDAGSVFGVMQQLLTRNRSAGDQIAGVPPVNGNIAGGHAGAGKAGQQAVSGGMQNTSGAGHTGVFVTQDIIAGLSDLQHDNHGVFHADDNQHTGDVIRTSLVSVIARPGEKDTKDIDRVDADTIDIVSMLFDYILDDRSLPDRFRALIARLQIPVIKVALLDKSFFARKAHPARQLLNELAFAASLQDAEVDTDFLFSKTEYIVEKILAEFDCDVNLFAEMLSGFKEFLQQESESSQMAREMLEHVKEEVARTIGHRVRNNTMPETVSDLLIKKWKDVMTHIGLRDGCEGDGWALAISVMDDLIWSVQPRLVVQERSQLTKSIPAILNGLQNGLTLIACPHDEIMAVFNTLESCHLESLRGLREVAHAAACIDPLPKQVNSADEDDYQYGSGADEFGGAEDDSHFVDSPYYYLVKGMELGSRVEFVDGSSVRRAKLAWKCDFTHEYTFVDRKYSLVADVALTDLLQDFENGRVRFVDEVPLLDRAFDAVVNGLRNCLTPKADNNPAPLSA